MTWRRIDPMVRFRAKVKADPAGCWVWTAARNHGGYGTFSPAHGHKWLAHRWSYTQLRGPIPDGLTLDHRCRNRACVNPDHLEPVTIAVNRFRARGTYCGRGLHVLDVSGVQDTDGKRRCGECRRTRQAERRARLAA